MKEFVYRFFRYGYFLDGQKSSAPFGQETAALLVIEPQEYELKISGETLRKASCTGYRIEITNKGAARFCDYQNNLLAELAETQKEFREFDFQWSENRLRVCFGHMETVDNYPNCDGEYDRWSTRWVKEYEVALDTATNQTEVTE